MFSNNYFTKVEKNGLTQFETMTSYLGFAFQTVIEITRP